VPDRGDDAEPPSSVDIRLGFRRDRNSSSATASRLLGAPLSTAGRERRPRAVGSPDIERLPGRIAPARIVSLRRHRSAGSVGGEAPLHYLWRQ
jgi:hypothetical protein